MSERHSIAVDGGKLHAVSQGEGPMVLMVHGNPGLAYSWRHQMQPLADAGYRAVAVDCLGYGESDRPTDMKYYDSNAVQQQLLAVVDHFGADKVVAVGQDFGAQYSWNLAVRAPERVQAVAATVPYDFDLAGRALKGSAPTGDDDSAAMASPNSRPTARYANMAAQHFVHLHYYQQVGPAERELGPQMREYLKRILYALSADGNLLNWANHKSEGTGYLDVLEPTPPLPWPWLSEAEFEVIVQSYERLGPELAQVGPLAAYRTADRNWEIGAKWADANVTQPALFICGAVDPVLYVIGQDWREKMQQRIPNLVEPCIVPGAGHMVQQEKPEEFNAALLQFLERDNVVQGWSR